VNETFGFFLIKKYGFYFSINTKEVIQVKSLNIVIDLTNL